LSIDVGGLTSISSYVSEPAEESEPPGV